MIAHITDTTILESRRHVCLFCVPCECVLSLVYFCSVFDLSILMSRCVYVCVFTKNDHQKWMCVPFSSAFCMCLCVCLCVCMCLCVCVFPFDLGGVCVFLFMQCALPAHLSTETVRKSLALRLPDQPHFHIAHCKIELCTLNIAH